jgi:hypothetical protein
VILNRFTTKAGLEGVVSDIRGEHLAGYVAVPVNAEINTSALSVHGGITWDQVTCAYPVQTVNQWRWLGSDCGHAGDTREECDQTYVEREIEALAGQVIYQIIGSLMGKE